MALTWCENEIFFPRRVRKKDLRDWKITSSGELEAKLHLSSGASSVGDEILKYLNAIVEQEIPLEGTFRRERIHDICANYIISQ